MKMRLLLFCVSFLIVWSLLNGITLLEIIRSKDRSEEQKIKELKLLIQEDKNLINMKSKDIPHITPLMLAADLGQDLVVKWLLSNNVQLNDLDSLNTPAIFYAARKGHVEVVKLLLDHGARIDGITTKQGNTIILDILRAYGANLDSAKDKTEFKKNILTIIQMLLDKGADINAQGSAAEGSRTPLMWAASWKNFELVRVLIQRKAQLCLKDRWGHTFDYYLPNPTKDRTLTKADREYIQVLKNLVIEECDWAEIKHSELTESGWVKI